jgi:Domain of unknown function (DUF4159)/Aerotolerance regulator N-terminal
MIFAAPWVLLALPALPLLWWLLRVTPPAPRSETFPAIRLLMGLHAREETPARTPWWLLALRMIAATLVILALARPVLDAGSTLPGSGPVLLVMDNGWASASDWPRRMQAASTLLDRVERTGRQAALLPTARDESGSAPQATAPMPVADLRARLAALHPQPWPPDRATATAALQAWRRSGGSVGGSAAGSVGGSPAGSIGGSPAGSIAYIGDGLTHGGDFALFGQALGDIGPVTEMRWPTAPARLLLPPQNEADGLVARMAQAPQPLASHAAVLAQSGDGRTLARTSLDLPAGAATGTATIALPPELRNRLNRLVLEGPPSAASIVLLDERWRRRPVGLVAGEVATADTPFAGPLYYLRRALTPFTEVREADLATLLQREISVLILADKPLPAGPERDALTRWVEQGGLLIRFAGPRTAEQPLGETDQLMPVKLLGGDRQLGGALSWSEPAGVAQFPASSPFNGLPVADEVKVSRQVLAEPSADLAAHTWAALADGTPLVTQATRGAGRIVLFHVTANADWSNLSLSGLFVDMLRRLVALSAGVATTADNAFLAPAETLDGYGLLSTPPQAATGLPANEIARTVASPRHPPGLYGPVNGRRALNLGANLPMPEAAPVVPGARVEDLGTTIPERALGPWLLAGAIVLLAFDLLIALGLRGLLRPSRVAAGLVLALLAAPGAQALESNPNPALATRLGYIATGDAQLDGIARAGLEGLSEYVNRRTAAALVEPDAVEPGRTDLSFYPLLYWPVSADAQPLSPVQTGALNDYMSRGGIILLDTRDSGSGAGFAPGTGSALQRIAQGLVIPPLAPLTTEHVLARAFYLLQDFPGRYTGEQVWVQRDQDRANDSVSPVIIGGNDWASAWAVDDSGRNPYAVIPGGSRQRTLAYRFGVNLVMYALTGNYKGDQVHVPAILQRLGQ